MYDYELTERQQQYCTLAYMHEVGDFSDEEEDAAIRQLNTMEAEDAIVYLHNSYEEDEIIAMGDASGRMMGDVIEDKFLAALDAQSEWELRDSGYMETLLVCAKCGHEEYLSDRETAIWWLESGECDNNTGGYHRDDRGRFVGGN